eukprot:244096-Pleurochrysis_carterae.AAC.2
MDYVVYRLPHLGANRRCDSNEESRTALPGKRLLTLGPHVAWLEICNVIVHLLLTGWDKIASTDPCTVLHSSLVTSTSHSWPFLDA